MGVMERDVEHAFRAAGEYLHGMRVRTLSQEQLPSRLWTAEHRRLGVHEDNVWPVSLPFAFTVEYLCSLLIGHRRRWSARDRNGTVEGTGVHTSRTSCPRRLLADAHIFSTQSFVVMTSFFPPPLVASPARVP